MAARFATTQWSVVLKARDQRAPEAREALAELCETYWYPIYAFVQRCGWDPVEAQDLTQTYFACLLEKNFLDSVRPDAGRFRSFLLASLKHFLANEWDKQAAQKRGGHLTRVALGDYEVAPPGGIEPTDYSNPEDVFEKKWAQTLSDRALGRLQAEWESRGKAEQFRLYEGFLTATETERTHEELAARLGQSTGATRVAVHRLRHRYAKLLREEVTGTVGDPQEIEDELRHVLELLADSRSAHSRERTRFR